MHKLKQHLPRWRQHFKDPTCRQAHRFGPPAPQDWQVPCSVNWMERLRTICTHTRLSRKESWYAHGRLWLWVHLRRPRHASLTFLVNEWKPTLDLWRRSSLVSSPMESWWGQMSCSAMAARSHRGRGGTSANVAIWQFNCTVGRMTGRCG